MLSGSGSLTSTARLVCHCLLIETEAGLVLVDAGLGLRDVESPELSLGSEFLVLLKPELDPAETALRQVEKLGFSRDDVRHVVLTHLDLDHAGGIQDFPKAVIHVHAREKDAALSPRTRLERRRYRPVHFQHGPSFSVYEPTGERWFGFDCVRDLRGLPPEILLVPLIGHSRGHSGVAVDTGSGWLLHAGDAYFHRAEMDPDRRRCPPLLDLFQRIVEIHGPARHKNQQRLRALVRENAGEVRVFSAHDKVELERALEHAGEPAHG